MEKEKVVFFLDYANINRAAREKRCQLDYYNLLQYVGENRFLIDAHCYVPVDPRNEHRIDGEIEELWRSGYIVNTKKGSVAGVTYKCNFDVEIAMDVLKVVYQVKPDIIVLATGDSDFVALIQEVRKSGIRVEVAAFPETAGVDIQLKCSGFIDMAVYYDSYLAAQHDDASEDGEESVEEQFTKLIQSQASELDEEDALAPEGLEEEDVIAPEDTDAVGEDTGVSVPDHIDDLDL